MLYVSALASIFTQTCFSGSLLRTCRLPSMARLTASPSPEPTATQSTTRGLRYNGGTTIGERANLGLFLFRSHFRSSPGLPPSPLPTQRWSAGRWSETPTRVAPWPSSSSAKSPALPSLPSSWTVESTPESGSPLLSVSGSSKRWGATVNQGHRFWTVDRAGLHLCPQALSTFGSDAQMTSLLNQMDVYVLPLFNIDGYEYTHTNVSCSFHPTEQLPTLTRSSVDLLHACVTQLLCPLWATIEQDVEKNSLQEVRNHLRWSWSQQELWRGLVQ